MKRIPQTGPGVYAIKNLISGKIYIGSTNDLQIRFRHHRNDLQNNRHKNMFLQLAWNKHGENAFSFEVIEQVTDIATLIEREQHWINHHQSFNRKRGYNICQFAGINTGLTHSPEARQKIREKLTGKTLPPSVRQKLSIANRKSRPELATIPDKDIHDIFQKVASGKTCKEVGDEYHVTHSHISAIIRREHRQYVPIPHDLIASAQAMLLRGSNPMKRNYRAIFTDEEVYDIRARYDAGQTIRAITRLYRCSRCSIQHIVHRQSYKFLPERDVPADVLMTLKEQTIQKSIPPKRRPQCRFTDADIYNIRARYDAGESCNSIAGSYGAGHSIIVNIAYRRSYQFLPEQNGSPCIPISPQRRKYALTPAQLRCCRFTDEEVYDIRSRHDCGESIGSLTRCYNVGRGVINNIVNRKSYLFLPEREATVAVTEAQTITNTPERSNGLPTQLTLF